jgi:hypothetical protein
MEKGLMHRRRVLALTLCMTGAGASAAFGQVFDVYAGNHTNRVAVRFQDVVLPFFSRTLSFDPALRPK